MIKETLREWLTRCLPRLGLLMGIDAAFYLSWSIFMHVIVPAPYCNNLLLLTIVIRTIVIFIIKDCVARTVTKIIGKIYRRAKKPTINCAIYSVLTGIVYLLPMWDDLQLYHRYGSGVHQQGSTLTCFG